VLKGDKMSHIESIERGLLIEIEEAINSLNYVIDETRRKTIYNSLPSMIKICEDITKYTERNEGEIFDETVNPFELKQRLYRLNNRNPYTN